HCYFCFREQKRLFKVEFVNWHNIHHFLNRLSFLPQYTFKSKSNKQRLTELTVAIRSFISRVRRLNKRDQFRERRKTAALNKVFDISTLPARGKIELVCQFESTHHLIRRRPPRLLMTLRRGKHLQQSLAFREQGHTR
uniref:Uncharacterized protein n=1 Tax=Sus scrofa TaxID=9823 RepID=A0A8D1NFL9_PIG